ncbi:Lrp/AsnC family transcriptional regulator [Achromobacter mucicolens]|uniref:Lrp/AsnC family transcriptional regulator n=2 Tax=Alcaligenaceae TaxID=506 RepID=UPI003B838263
MLAILANFDTIPGTTHHSKLEFRSSMPKRQLDAYDRRILEALQKNGRLTNVELADQIGLSPSPCLRRVRMMEEAGVIQGYEARLDPHEVGLGLTVFVGVKVERHHERDAEMFRNEVSALPEVIAAHLVSGESDFLLQVVVPDLRGYEHFLLHTLLKLPGVKDIRSNFAIQTVKPQSPLPLDHLGR